MEEIARWGSKIRRKEHVLRMHTNKNMHERKVSNNKKTEDGKIAGHHHKKFNKSK